jgi:hypothetical protein
MRVSRSLRIIYQLSFHISPVLENRLPNKWWRLCRVDGQGMVLVNVLAPFAKPWPSPQRSTVSPVGFNIAWSTRRATSIYT